MQNVHGCITRTNPKSASLWVCISDSCGPRQFCSELMWARYINTKNPRTQSLQHGLSEANSVHGYPLDPKCNTKMTRGSRRHCTVQTTAATAKKNNTSLEGNSIHWGWMGCCRQNASTVQLRVCSVCVYAPACGVIPHHLHYLQIIRSSSWLFSTLCHIIIMTLDPVNLYPICMWESQANPACAWPCACTVDPSTMSQSTSRS